MSFASPQLSFLFLSLPIAVALIVIGRIIQKKQLSKIIHDKLWKTLVPSHSLFRRLIKVCLFLMAVSLVILSLMRPQYGTRISQVKREGIDIYLAMDSSLSMLTEDVSPNRFEKARQEMISLLTQVSGDRISLISFSGTAYVNCPLTLDYSAIKLFLEDMYVGMVSRPGTNVDSIFTLLNKNIGRRDKSPKALIIFTDGESDSTVSEKNRLALQKKGFSLIVVGVGTKKGAPIPLRNDRKELLSYKRDKDGEVVISSLNKKTIVQLVQKMDGLFIEANNQRIAVNAIYKYLANQEKQVLELKLKKSNKDQYQFYLFLAFMLLIIEEGLSLRKKEALKKG